MTTITVSEKIKWVEMDSIKGNVNCPVCGQVMIISPMASLPTIAFCVKCMKYFCDNSKIKFGSWGQKK